MGGRGARGRGIRDPGGGGVDDDPDRRDPAGPSEPAGPSDPTGPGDPTGPAPRPDLRVGDVDRQAALQALGAHLEAGRLDVDEYGDRSACAAVAVRRAELAVLFDDLPAPHPALPERPVPAVPVAAAAPDRPGRDRTPAGQAAVFALAMIMMIALPGLLFAAGTAGMGGGGLLFLPLMVLLVGSTRHGRRRFGPGGHGHRGPGRGPWPR